MTNPTPNLPAPQFNKKYYREEQTKVNISQYSVVYQFEFIKGNG